MFQHLFKLLYVGLECHIDSSANQSNYTVGDNHPVLRKSAKSNTEYQIPNRQIANTEYQILACITFYAFYTDLKICQIFNDDLKF